MAWGAVNLVYGLLFRPVSIGAAANLKLPNMQEWQRQVPFDRESCGV
jgi:hypothetical protein